MSHHRKFEVKDSEKSGKVVMNNWNLDMILSKEMACINKSERTVINNFTMEQKLLHKRWVRFSLVSYCPNSVTEENGYILIELY